MPPRANAVFRERRAGVLLHVSSLPSPHGIGDLGPSAHAFADWCVQSGNSIWQMLPVGPVGPGDSPYASTSSFAGEPLFVSLDDLRAKRLLTVAQCRAGRNSRIHNTGSVNYSAVRAFKIPRLVQAYENWRHKRGHRAADFRKWQSSQSSWLTSWCHFASAAPGAVSDLGYHAFVQWMFHDQWSSLRRHCTRRGVKLLGDVPIFVPLNSADVVQHRNLFRLDSLGRPTVRTGVPPDCFSTTGQLWGHPHYRWSEHRKTKFAWWVARIRHSLTRFDALRIDHFVGFVHAYEISGSAKTARKGCWKPAPGLELLTALERACGPLPLVAEDLGAVTPEVNALRQRFGLPGMKLVHNAFYGPRSADLPALHPESCVAYPGTHDNNTTAGWWRSLDAAARRRFVAYAGLTRAHEVPAAMNRIVMQSPARTAIIAMQDYLGLGAEARMNTPGVPRGQWRWRLSMDALQGADAANILRLAEASART